MNESRFTIAIEELQQLLGRIQIDLTVTQRELRRADETNAALLERIRELEAKPGTKKAGLNAQGA